MNDTWILPYQTFARYDVFDGLMHTYTLPTTTFVRERVREALGGLVEKLFPDDIPWCAYLATMSGLCDITEDGELLSPDDFLGIMKYVDDYDPVPPPPQPVMPVEPVRASGNLTTQPEGPFAIRMGGRDFYLSARAAPVDVEVCSWYFQVLYSESLDIPPMSANYDSPFEMGRALKNSRLDQAMEIVAAIDPSEILYIPGDGVGAFSFAALRLGRAYLSTEPGGVGQIARDLGLIRSRSPYTVAEFETVEYCLIASNLIPFAPEVLQWPGKKVVFDASCFFEKHPEDLVPVFDTGFRLYHSRNLVFKIFPNFLRKKVTATPMHVSRWMQQLHFKKCDAFYTDDKRSLVLLMSMRIPVVSNTFAHRGHHTFYIRPPDPKQQYLCVGQEAGIYDLLTASDMNSLPGGVQQRLMLLGRESLRVYGQVGTINRKDPRDFGTVMTFRSDDSYQKFYGKTRSFHHYRLIQVYDAEQKGMIGGIRTRVPPPPNVIVLVGYRVQSAVVLRTWPVDGGFESSLEVGVEVATLYNRDVWRRESELERAYASGELEVSGSKRCYRWANANTYDR